MILTTCRSYIPVGTTINPSFYAMHRDPRNFAPRTNEFWPERWLRASDAAHLPPGDSPTDDEAPRVHNEGAFLAFSHGPMNCVGKGLAMQEIRTVVCALVQQYEFRLRKDWDPRAYSEGYKDYFVSTRPEVPVVVARRS